ncbi:MAG TPA: glycosyltransferase [Steroidobacteraceae bacterium]|nr:glycosyltransferase [Steroidobacteraceae bacterium]
MRVRIVHFIECMNPDHGGPPAIVARLAAAQARLDHDVTLLTTFDPPEAAAAIERVFGHVDHFGSVRQRCVNARSIPSRFGPGAYRAMAATLDQADVVHIHAIWDPLLKRGMQHCHRAGIPLCVTPHGLLTRYSMSLRTWKKRLALAAGWNSALNGANLLHCLTEGEGADARALGLTSPRVVLPNAVDPQELSQVAGALAAGQVLPAHASRRFILSLGRLHETKGLDILCDAFAIVAAARPDVDLVIAGPDFGYEARLRSHVERLGLARRVHVVGPVFGAAKVALLRTALCLCQPSRQEGFSMTILEALACGVPAVISTECHFPEVQSAGAGFVVPLDAGATALSLLALLNDETVRSAAAAAALRLVLTRYTVDRMAKSLIENYVAVGARAR